MGVEPGGKESLLFAPGFIGAVEIPNRIVMPAMTTRLADREGHVTDATIAYFGARAAGGAGLITVEMASPERVGRHRFHELGIYDDRYIPGLRRLTDALHAHGAKASIQLGHAGGHTREDICGEPPIAPSAVPHYVFELRGETITPLEMTQPRIAQTTHAFVEAAARAQAAGFDMVELHVKQAVDVPVIAVGRLGSPALAMETVDSGKADFVALGRTLIADPQWPAKVRAGIPIRRCLACNRCVDEMRSGEKLGCVVNPAAADELAYAGSEALPRGERICVLGAGPAGLSYAALVAGDNEVTVFERETRPGGALRYAGYAPRFQNVEARQEPLDAYVDELERACRAKSVVFRYASSISNIDDIARDFDRVVVATGARYPRGTNRLVKRLLASGWGKSRLARRLFDSTAVRDWFYYRARRSAPPAVSKLDGKRVVVIGDAAAPGRMRDAIRSAYKAAFSK